jgi:3-hydroxymyristoyl/3-hydroxydecanoyl-(acyl carrier protein) dehydratase/malonyl CoA-acyl carrier protein transacylase
MDHPGSNCSAFASCAVPIDLPMGPTLRVYSGADRDTVLRALAEDRQAAAGPARLAIVADEREPLSARADAARRWLTAGGPRPDGIAYRDEPLDGEIAFVFTNGSAAYPGMGAEVSRAFPGVVSGLDEQGTTWPLGERDVLAQMWDAGLLGRLHARITREVLGLWPTAAIGYSSGEPAALAALGAWTDMRSLRADLRASELFSTELTGEFRAVRRAWRRLGVTGERWVNYAVSASPEQVRAALADLVAVHLLAVNAPGTCLVGGEQMACEAALARLGADAIPIDYPIAAHAPELAEVAAEYRRLHLRPTTEVPGVRFYSGATGEPYPLSADRAADAILAQALDTVDFVRVIERAWTDGVRVFVEHGPQGQCTGWIRRILGTRDHLAVALDAPGGRALRRICQSVAELAAAGVPCQAGAFFGHLGGAVGQTEQATVLLRAPSLPLVLPDPRALVPPDSRTVGAANISDISPKMVNVEDHVKRVAGLHRDFLAHQAEAHVQFLRTMTVARTPGSVSSDRTANGRGLPGPKFGRAELEHLADGKISEVLGPLFAAQDHLFRQTRLPKPPLLLVDRVTGIEGAAASMGTGTIWTETDVTGDSWYLDGTGHMPAGIMAEAGQALLLLISWLGINLHCGGDRVYRLLGCEFTYHGSLATAGDTLRYEIHVDKHTEQDGIRLFFFHYDCYAGDELRLTLSSGQAGFFTDEELRQATGLRWDPCHEDPGPGSPDPPRIVPPRRLGQGAVRAFAAGRPADCFGDGWRGARKHARTPRISSGRLLLLDEVTDVDPAGGPWGRGYLRAEAAVSADDWFFARHFKNDPCMPGTLMFEGALQAMAFYLAALGFTLDHDGWRFEPMTGQGRLVRWRGQVSPASSRIVYEVFVTALSADPYPTLHADVLATVDGVKAFHVHRAGLRLVPG